MGRGNEAPSSLTAQAGRFVQWRPALLFDGPERPRFEHVAESNCRAHNADNWRLEKLLLVGLTRAADGPRKRSSTLSNRESLTPAQWRPAFAFAAILRVQIKDGHLSYALSMPCSDELGG